MAMVEAEGMRIVATDEAAAQTIARDRLLRYWLSHRTPYDIDSATVPPPVLRANPIDSATGPADIHIYNIYIYIYVYICICIYV